MKKAIILIFAVFLMFAACTGKTLLTPKADSEASFEERADSKTGFELKADTETGFEVKEDPETDFESSPFEGEKAVMITEYKGEKREVVIPSKIQGLSVTEIGERAFQEKSLVKVTIPDSVTYIGNEAFANNQLTSITIPDSVINFITNAFENNQNMTAINVSSGNPNYSSIDGILYNKEGTVLLKHPAGKSGTVTIPSSVTEIGEHAFSGNQLTSITIPDSVTEIRIGAFINNQLTSVIIPASIISIEMSAFSRNQLTSITIPNSVTTIEAWTFSDNQLTSVTIPDSVTSIKNGAFEDNQLTSITIGADVNINNPFNNGFERVYNNGGKLAGTYTRPNTDSRTWTRQ